MLAKSILFTEPNQVELGEVELPSPGEGEVLLEIEYSCISPGTDLRTLAGMQTSAKEWPLIPGYSQVGRIIGKGPGVSLEEGTAVFSLGTQKASVATTWGAHISHSLVAEASVYPLPEGVELLEASASKLAAISYHGSLCSGVKAGDKVAVVGLGPIGMLSAIFHQAAGARVIAFDLSAERCEAAGRMGIEAHVPEHSLQASSEQYFAKGPDIVVDSTGVEKVLADCVSMAREIPWADYDFQPTRLLLQGSYPGTFSLDYVATFLKELSIIVPRDQRPCDLRAVLDKLGDGTVRIGGIISKVVPYRKGPDIFAELRANKGEILTAAIKWKE